MADYLMQLNDLAFAFQIMTYLLLALSFLYLYTVTDLKKHTLEHGHYTLHRLRKHAGYGLFWSIIGSQSLVFVWIGMHLQIPAMFFALVGVLFIPLYVFTLIQLSRYTVRWARFNDSLIR